MTSRRRPNRPVADLSRHSRHHHPRHFRIKPANPVGTDYKVSRIEHVSLDEIQHRTIDLWPLRLHQIENEFRRSVAAFVHYSNCRVVAVGNSLDPNFAFEGRIGVVQYRVDRVRRIAVAR
jgi:hypothetical protein